MLTIFRQPHLCERVLFQCLTFEEAHATVLTCRDARRLRFRAQALCFESESQRRQIWDAHFVDLASVTALVLSEDWNGFELPPNLVDLLIDVKVKVTVPATVRVLWFCGFVHHLDATFARDLHTLVVNRGLSDQDVNNLARTCPNLRSLGCNALNSVGGLELTRLACVWQARLPPVGPSIRSLKIHGLQAWPGLSGLEKVRRLSLHSSNRDNQVHMDELADLHALEVLYLAGFTVFLGAARLPVSVLSLTNTTIASVPGVGLRVIDLRHMARLRSVVLSLEWSVVLSVRLPPDVECLELLDVRVSGDLFTERVQLGCVKDLSLSLSLWEKLTTPLLIPTYFCVNRLKLSCSSNFASSLCLALLGAFPETNDLTLSGFKWMKGLTVKDSTLGALLTQLRRLKLLWSGEKSALVQSLISNTGPGLRELVLGSVANQKIEIDIPENVRQNLGFLKVAGQILIPTPSVSRPADFIRNKVDKFFV